MQRGQLVPAPRYNYCLTWQYKCFAYISVSGKYRLIYVLCQNIEIAFLLDWIHCYSTVTVLSLHFLMHCSVPYEWHKACCAIPNYGHRPVLQNTSNICYIYIEPWAFILLIIPMNKFKAIGQLYLKPCFVGHFAIKQMFPDNLFHLLVAIINLKIHFYISQYYNTFLNRILCLADFLCLLSQLWKFRIYNFLSNSFYFSNCFLGISLQHFHTMTNVTSCTFGMITIFLKCSFTSFRPNSC